MEQAEIQNLAQVVDEPPWARNRWNAEQVPATVTGSNRPHAATDLLSRVGFGSCGLRPVFGVAEWAAINSPPELRPKNCPDTCGRSPRVESKSVHVSRRVPGSTSRFQDATWMYSPPSCYGSYGAAR
jgi:hypothetical protein